MYRNRARNAHVLHPDASVGPPLSSGAQAPPNPEQFQQSSAYPTQPGGYNPAAFQDPAPVPLFNPLAYQNGHTGSSLEQEPAGGAPESLAPAETKNDQLWSQEQPAWAHPAPSLNNNINPVEEYAQPAQEEGHAMDQPYAELVLDSSGQWYWDYNQQQWFPYYQQDQAGQDQDVQEISNSLGGMHMEPAGEQRQSAEPVHALNNNAEELGRDGRESQVSNGAYQQDSSWDRQPSVEEANYQHHYGYEVTQAAEFSDPFSVQDPYTEEYPDTEQPTVPEQYDAPESNAERSMSPVNLVDQHSLEPGAAMGPPDLVDHRPNASQPEIVSDINFPNFSGQSYSTAPAQSVPPPDMFASLPGSSGLSHAAQPQSNPDLGVDTRLVPHSGAADPSDRTSPDFGAGDGPGLDLGFAHPPCGRSDLNATAAGATASARTAPDLTSQSVIHDLGLHSVEQSSPVSESVSHDQHYDFYKGQIESAMPDLTSGRSGVPLPQVRSSVPPQDVQGKAPDILRTEPLVPTSDRNLFMETGELREEDANRFSYPPPLNLSSSSSATPSGKPPSGLPPMVGGNEAPSLVRMVVGESVAEAGTALNSGQRMVEGESSQSPSVQPPLLQLRDIHELREIEGEALQDPLNYANPRTIVGEDRSGPPALTPPVRSREIEGQNQSVPMRGTVAQNLMVSPPEPEYGSSVTSTPVTSSPTHIHSHTEVRSEAAGSDRRDQTVMGGPPAMKAPPLPMPGRAVAGQESSSPYEARRRGDEHKKSTFDTDEERNQDSDSERERERNRIQPRRTVSPSARSSRSKPGRGYERLNRSSTDRDEDSDKKPRDHYRDSREDDRFYRKDYSRSDRGKYRDYRRYRDEEEDYREDDRRSQHGSSRRIKEEPRYRDDTYYRRNRMDLDYERESYYGDDILNRSRPGSRAGSVSHYDPNESVYSRAGNMAYFQQQLLQQQLALMNPLQFQIQTAVREMEKVLENPVNVGIYKQHWETYERQPQQMEKLRLENPVMHHLLNHFRQHFWHLVEEKKPVLKETKREAVKEELDQFTQQFHQHSPSHRDESISAGLESTILQQEDSAFAYSDSSVVPERLTPLMFSRPHVCARISATGVLVKVEAAAPQEGQTATVEIHSLSALLAHTKEHQQLAAFPGPLNPRETHKNDVIKFCERKILEGRERRLFDRDSYELLWNMMILLLRQKGQVEGSDLADLLLREENRHETGRDNHIERSQEYPLERSRASSYRGAVDPEESSMSSYSEEAVDRTTASRSIINPAASQDETVSKFRSYLLHGNKQEGLEYAMRAGLWGHALFLASKMDQRTYARVMTRFANGLAINDPLQTLYQLMSARMPSAMKHCADQRWGDWRPHLAMILSNPLPGSDLNRRSMVTLGDTLMSKGQLYAAQFCYIVSAVEFGTFSKKSSKLVLLCSSVGDKSVDEFASNEAIQCTEIYEFVQKLGNQDYEMPTLQVFKFLHAIRLCEVGLASRAQDYCREIAEFISRHPSRVETDFLPDFLQQLSYLAERLKYQDPQYTTNSGEIAEIPDPDWMLRFSETLQSLSQSGVTESTEPERASSSAAAQEQNGYFDQQYQYYQQGYEYPSSTEQAATVDYHGGGGETQEVEQAPHQEPEPHLEPPPEPQSHIEPVPTHQPMYNPAAFGTTNLQPQPPEPGLYQPLPLNASAPSSRRSSLVAPSLSRRESVNEPPDMGYYGQVQTRPPPTIMQPSTPPSPTKPMQQVTEQNNNSKTSNNNKTESSKADKKTEKSKKSSWFGGIFGKILKAPNQVHLPEDSDRSIVYDEKLGRWVNKDGDEDSLAPVAAPPMDPAFMGGLSPIPNGGSNHDVSGSSQTSTQSFRAPKRRGRGYVDVFGQSGATKPVVAPPLMFPNGAEPSGLPPIPTIFNPSLVPSSEDGTAQPIEPVPYGGSRETEPREPSIPMMFNPSSMGGVTEPPTF